MLNTEEIKNWEDEFARNLGICSPNCDCGHCENRRDIINTILSQQLSKQREEIEEKIEKTLQQDLDYGRFGLICSNETTFKRYVLDTVLSILDTAKSESEGKEK